jgi:hypothetical protein
MRERVAPIYREDRAQLAPLAVLYQRIGVTAQEVVAAIALYHGLTLQQNADPNAIRPDLVADVLRALRTGESA